MNDFSSPAFLFQYYNKIRFGISTRVFTSNQMYNQCLRLSQNVQKIKTNPLARKVKIADLKHNLDTTRTGNYPRKYGLYKEALAYLENE